MTLIERYQAEEKQLAERKSDLSDRHTSALAQRDEIESGLAAINEHIDELEVSGQLVDAQLDRVRELIAEMESETNGNG